MGHKSCNKEGLHRMVRVQSLSELNAGLGLDRISLPFDTRYLKWSFVFFIFYWESGARMRCSWYGGRRGRSSAARAADGRRRAPTSAPFLRRRVRRAARPTWRSRPVRPVLKHETCAWAMAPVSSDWTKSFVLAWNFGAIVFLSFIALAVALFFLLLQPPGSFSRYFRECSRFPCPCLGSINWFKRKNFEVNFNETLFMFDYNDPIYKLIV